MKIFKDPYLKEEIEGDKFDFGIVPAGDVKQFTFYVLNDSTGVLEDLKFELEHDELTVIKAPERLIPQDSGELIIEWNCRIDVEEGLQAKLNIKANKIVG